MTANRDCNGRDLAIGDPVTVSGEIAKGGRGYGRRSHGTVVSIGPVNVKVQITHSEWEGLSGQAVPVRGEHLKHGHVGHVRLGDAMREATEGFAAEIEKGKRDRAETVLSEVIRIAIERSIITPEQGRELWLLQSEIPQPPPLRQPNHGD